MSCVKYHHQHFVLSINSGEAHGRTTHSDGNGAALAALLRRQRVRFTERGAPVPSPNGQHAQLGDDDGCADGRGDFFGRLDAETDVAFRIANNDNGLESSTLTGARLLLYGLDLCSRQ